MQTIPRGRPGGLARSPAKTKANRAKALTFWAQVRAGQLPQPRRGARVYDRDEPVSTRAVDLVRGKVYANDQIYDMLMRELALSRPEALRLVASLQHSGRLAYRCVDPGQWICSDPQTMAAILPPERQP